MKPKPVTASSSPDVTFRPSAIADMNAFGAATEADISFTQSALPLQPRIRTRHGTMACASLRPGMWLQTKDGFPILVGINSAKLGRVYLMYGGFGQGDSWEHESLVLLEHRCMGQGKRRWWYRAWMQKLTISEYSQPHP